VHRYFDYTTAAAEAGISAEALAALRRRVEGEYLSPMLREMHLWMLCRAIGKGECTPADALRPRNGNLPPILELRLGG